MRAIVDAGTVVASLGTRILGRTAAEPLTDLDGLIAFWIFTTELPVVRETIGRGMTPCAALPTRSATRSNSATNSNWAKPSGCMFNPVSSPSSPPPRKTPI